MEVRRRLEFAKRYPQLVTAPLRKTLMDRAYAAPWPSISKARVVDDPLPVLVDVNHRRHFGIGPTDVAKVDQPWSSKAATCVWRGASTNLEGEDGNERSDRVRLVQRWAGTYDVGLSTLTTEGREQGLAAYLREPLTLRDQLQHKYILCPEGNDVATCLKWVMLSNSVPLMPTPRRETVFLEGWLRPYVHYVPVAADWHDLPARLAWCQQNDRACQQISLNGKAWAAAFFDPALSAQVAELVQRRVAEALRPALHPASRQVLAAPVAVPATGPVAAPPAPSQRMPLQAARGRRKAVRMLPKLQR